ALSVAAATAKTAYGVSSTGVAGTTLKTAVDTALGIVSPIVEPVSKVFTTALDTLVGGDGNDTFTGTVRATSSQVESGDQVSGGAGTDTVALKMADKGGGSLDLKLTGVERVDLEMYSSLAMSGIDWTGVKTVVMGGPAGSLTLTDLSGPIDLELTGKDYGQNPVDRDLTATYRSLSGASDALSLSIANLTGVSAEINQGTSEGIFESVAVSISQSGSGGTFGIFGSAFSGSTSLTVTGSDSEKMTLNLSSGQKVGNVTFTGTGSGSTVNISVGASGSADQTVSFAAAGAPATYTIGQEGSKSLTGSPFNDSITVSSTGSGSVTGSLGGGNDTITVNSLPVGATGGHSIDGGDGNDSITIASNRNASVTGGDGADTITFSGTGSGNLVISAGSGADVLTITLAGQHSVDMGAGADTITAVSAVSSDDTIDGGLDSDYMSFSLAVQTTTPKISNVETLGVQFSTTGSRRLVGSDLNGVTEIRSTGSGTSAGQVYMTSMSGNMTLNFAEAAATGTNTIAFKEGADATLTLKGTGAAAATVFDLTNVQNLVVTTNSSNATNNWGVAGVVQINLDDVDTDTVTI
ncbi:MAG: hypothetical protein EBU08_17310, partial [Micrococcales bacterium]|nr:hypothetical protein [Micrococcales bacterium]